FDRAAAASENDDIDEPGAFVEVADSGSDRGAAGCALHGCRVDEQVEAGVAAASDVDDIADDRSGGRGNDAHAAREGRKGALAVGVEESFGEEAGLELLEGEL